MNERKWKSHGMCSMTPQGMKSVKSLWETYRIHVNYRKETTSRKNKPTQNGARNLYINIRDILTNPVYGPSFDLIQIHKMLKINTIWKM